MSIESQLEREEEAIYDEYERGSITREEMNRQIRDLHADYRAAAREAAQDAYDAELERW